MNTPLWTKDQQTQGKHLILRNYLNGWFPILGSSNGRLLFIDGFAGPGEYDNGEPRVASNRLGLCTTPESSRPSQERRGDLLIHRIR